MTEKKENIVPIWEKYALTINEATEYFNIGDKKLRNLVDTYRDYGFSIMNGAKVLIKRVKFEEFLNETNAL